MALCFILPFLSLSPLSPLPPPSCILQQPSDPLISTRKSMLTHLLSGPSVACGLCFVPSASSQKMVLICLSIVCNICPTKMLCQNEVSWWNISLNQHNTVLCLCFFFLLSHLNLFIRIFFFKYVVFINGKWIFSFMFCDAPLVWSELIACSVGGVHYTCFSCQDWD